MQQLNWILERQREQWFDVVNELANGRKETHWCWFFVPNVPGLGQSEMARAAAVTPEEFAECMENQEYAGYISAVIFLVDQAVRNNLRMSIFEVLGDNEVDVLKWTSFMTLVRALYHREILTFSPNINEIIKWSQVKYGVCEHTVQAVRAVEHKFDPITIQGDQTTKNRPY
jgi:uncharacterized protein (DUF1810 family)